MIDNFMGHIFLTRAEESPLSSVIVFLGKTRKKNLVGFILNKRVAHVSLSSDFFQTLSIDEKVHDSHFAQGGLLQEENFSADMTEKKLGGHLQSSFPFQKMPIYWGGQEKQDTSWVIHPSQYKKKSTKTFSRLCSITPLEEVIEDIMAGSGPSQFKVMAGHVTWSYKQFEQTLKENFWVKVPESHRLLFETADNKIHSQVLSEFYGKDKTANPQAQFSFTSYGNA